jgi:small basic protein (TIGR04137 family)
MVRLLPGESVSNIESITNFDHAKGGREALPWCVFEDKMSLDKSLKKSGSLARSRNVLSRAERLALLQEDELWKPTAGVYNLPKTKYRRLAPGQSGPKRPDVKA